LGLKQLWLKDESFNPTASLKDRASTIVIRHALEIEAQTVVTASTGNAGAALAGMAAALGRRAVVFAPRDAPQAKVAQLLVFGAQVLLVDGSYDDAVDLSLKTAEAFGWYCRNTGTNPFTLEGKKTAALEIWEAMFSGKIQIGAEPLSVFVSVGDGNIISGLHKGFKDLHALGWLEQIPRLYGVQAEGSAAIARTFTSGSEVIQPVEARTLADSISVNSPGDGQRALRAVRETGGQYVTVTDEQILQAVAELGRDGIFAEPAGAAGYAGLVAAVAQGLIDPKDPVLVINTGSGLKDPRSATLAVGQPSIIEPTLQAVQKQIEVQIEH
jgi:threonine synthase